MAKAKEESPLQALKADIASGAPANFYIFHGEEVFLLQHYAAQLRKTVLDPVTESFNYHRFNQETFDLRSFADAVENLPMMAERTLVQVDDVDLFKLNEDGREKMVQLLSDIPEYCTILFLYQSTPFKPDKRLKKLWEAVSAAQILEFQKQQSRDLIPWIQRHFSAQKKQITPELCLYLIELTDGTMTSISGEIQKIASYSGADHICKADIDAVTEPVLDAVAYQLTDQLSAGNHFAALQILQKLLKMQQEPLLILGAVGSHFRRLSTARILLDHGRKASELSQLCGLQDYAARKAMDACRRFSPRFYRQALELILETDRKIKTSFDVPQRLLELLILQLAQEAKV